MNRTKLKNYSPQARRDFIQAMTDRAAFYGLTAKKTEPVVERGDVAVIAGREHPRTVAKKRKQLEDRIKRHGFEQTMEALAYTWFNRLVAIRFMELHPYLDHGYRVLSHPEGKPTPEILEHAEHVELPGLKPETVIDLKLAGNKEAELYRRLLIAQCNALHDAMPFLFEKIDDETELLLPDNLLHSDSLIRKLVSEIDEEDWQEVEIIGWLYQFYISVKKDEVIGKVVASEDIPAATQLFTPNWIVKYLVQNTLGRQWLATYPHSSLRQQMQYYIEPAEQTPEVQEQLKAITPTNLNPEELTLLDPACGSGHILVEAYDLFKAIYQERGYRAKDIPALILQKNLFGLEIDDRAEQLAAFALMMKARADDRRIFDSEAKPNILAFEDSQGMNPADITHALNSPINKEEMPPSEFLFEEIENENTPLFSKRALAEKGHVSQGDIASLLALFENARTFGSLIQVPPRLAAKLPEIERRLNEVLKHGDLTHTSAHVIKPLIQQTRMLARQYDAVVANPPYMDSKYFSPILKDYLLEKFGAYSKNLFSAFIIRNLHVTKTTGNSSCVTPFVWMYINSFEPLRSLLLSEYSITSLVKPSYTSFFESAIVSLVAFVVERRSEGYRGTFFDLGYLGSAESQPVKLRHGITSTDCDYKHTATSHDFKDIPGSPLAYWASPASRKAFVDNPQLSTALNTREGLTTGNNELFMRRWCEVSIRNIGFELSSGQDTGCVGSRWFPYLKGGDYRRWAGNTEHVVNWYMDGKDLRSFSDPSSGRIRSHNYNGTYSFSPGVTWSGISSGAFAVRVVAGGFMFDTKGPMGFPVRPGELLGIAGLLNSVVVGHLLKMLAPTVDFKLGHVLNLPFKSEPVNAAQHGVAQCVQLSEADWDSFERSWNFKSLPIVKLASEAPSTLESSYIFLVKQNQADVAAVKQLEEENNRLFIDAYGLAGELNPELPIEQVTLTVNPAYRYGNKTSEVELCVRYRQDTMKELISYAVGCVMGRYSLDKPGLIYAHGGNVGFDLGQYRTFPADPDGIVPVMEADWFVDDATNRFIEFVGVAWPREHLQENLKFVADSLGPSREEQPRDTIRRYLATGFYKHHLQTYKKRPIYWLFSSGKQRTFQCLVYLHRYHEGTLARMRTEYVIPLQGQIASRIEQLEGDKVKATSTSHRNRLQKEQDNLKKQQMELLAFEEKLKHAAEQKISLDLDDGVKVNYGKFGDLLAESKAITGGKDEE